MDELPRGPPTLTLYAFPIPPATGGVNCSRRTDRFRETRQVIDAVTGAQRTPTDIIAGWQGPETWRILRQRRDSQLTNPKR